MQTPVSMLAGIAGKGNTGFVLTLLVGLAVLVALKQGVSTPSATATALRN
jgi:hypothetical protein